MQSTRPKTPRNKRDTTDADNVEYKAVDDGGIAKVDALADENIHSRTVDARPKDETSRTEDVLHRLADILAEQNNRTNSQH